MKKNLIVASILLAGSGALYATLSLMEEPAAASFPRVVIIIMGCLGLMLLVQTLVIRQRTERQVLQSDRIADEDKTKDKPDIAGGFPLATLIGCFVLIVIYFFVMEDLGFYVSAFLYFITATFIFGRKDLSLRKGAMRIGIAFIFTAILFVLFNKLLVVQTPKGLFF